MLSKNCFTFPFYLPRICRLWSNWPEYLLNYVSRGKRPAQYRMRNGIRLNDVGGALAGTIAVVFVRREYVRLEQYRTIVDIGAHMGTFSVYAAQSCPDARVYCYEPERGNFDVLQRNIGLNGLEGRVSAFNSAVGSVNDRRSLSVGGSLLNSFHIIPDGADSQTVNCTTLHDVLAGHQLETVDLLKMNCEGAEYEILESCSLEDFERIRKIRLEYHNLNEQHHGESLAGFLATRGYKIERFTRYLNRSGFIWAARSVSVAFSPDLLCAF